MTEFIAFFCAFRHRKYARTALGGLLLLTVVFNSGAYGADEGDMAMRLGGCGGVYFYASPGELWVEVQKQDINTRHSRTHLRALLFAPDRTVADEAWIADDGQATGSGSGPVQRVLLRTNVERAGVYGLNVTVSEDRYDENMSWGFTSNCAKYLIETSRGHKDALHLVFRLWLNDNKYYPAGYYANLAYMRKLPAEEWSDARPLVVAPFSEYSIFYHRLTIDRKGALFLSYDYWSTFWFYRTDHRGNRRSLLMSPDGGDTWRLAPSMTGGQ